MFSKTAGFRHDSIAMATAAVQSLATDRQWTVTATEDAAVFTDGTLAQIDVGLGRLEDAFANYSAALDLDPALSKDYARSLSLLGFLPLSNAPDGVLTALRRCIDVKKATCRVTS